MAELDGFTLFKVPKGWQLSTRLVGEVGWSIQIIDEEQAKSIIDRMSDIEVQSTNRTLPAPAPLTGRLFEKEELAAEMPVRPKFTRGKP